MFKINYKLFNIDQNDDLNGENGYFNFVVDGESYGIIINDEIDDFSVSVYDWFSSFLKALKILETHNYILINDIESFNTWIEISKKEEYVYISKVTGDKVGAGALIRKEKLSDIQYNSWENKKVLFSDFKIEISKKSANYLADLINLNSLENNKVLELNNLIHAVN